MPQAVPTDRYRDTALSELVAEPSKQRLPCREILLALNPAGATDPRCGREMGSHNVLRMHLLLSVGS